VVAAAGGEGCSVKGASTASGRHGRVPNLLNNCRRWAPAPAHPGPSRCAATRSVGGSRRPFAVSGLGVGIVGRNARRRSVDGDIALAYILANCGAIGLNFVSRSGRDKGYRRRRNRSAEYSVHRFGDGRFSSVCVSAGMLEVVRGVFCRISKRYRKLLR
jgi:hypothetical protein